MGTAKIAGELADKLDSLAAIIPEHPVEKVACDEELDAKHTLNFLKFFSMPVTE